MLEVRKLLNRKYQTADAFCLLVEKLNLEPIVFNKVDFRMYNNTYQNKKRWCDCQRDCPPESQRPNSVEGHLKTFNNEQNLYIYIYQCTRLIWCIMTFVHFKDWVFCFVIHLFRNVNLNAYKHYFVPLDSYAKFQNFHSGLNDIVKWAKSGVKHYNNQYQLIPTYNRQ